MKRMILAAMLMATPVQAQLGFDAARQGAFFGIWLFQQFPPEQSRPPQPPTAVYPQGQPQTQGPVACPMVPYDVLPDGRVLARPHCRN